MAIGADALEGALRGLAAGIRGVTAGQVLVAQARNERERQARADELKRAELKLAQDTFALQQELGRGKLTLGQDRFKAEDRRESARVTSEKEARDAKVASEEAKRQHEIDLLLTEQQRLDERDRQERAFKHRQEVERQASEEKKSSVEQATKVLQELIKSGGISGATQLPEPFVSVLPFAVKDPKDVPKQAQQIQQFLGRNQEDQAKKFLLNIALDNTDSTTRSKLIEIDMQKARIGRIESALQKYYASGAETGFIEGFLEKRLSALLAQTQDPNLQAILQEINSALFEYRANISGAAFSDQEARDYASQFPDISGSRELNFTRLNGLRRQYNANQEIHFDAALGGMGLYKMLFPETESGTDSTQSNFRPTSSEKLRDAGIVNPPSGDALDRPGTNGKVQGPPVTQPVISDDEIRRIIRGNQ